MKYFNIIKLRENSTLKNVAATWFHNKWGISECVYLDSMEACLNKTSAVPQWYVAVQGDMIIGGLGVIDNDFHNRKDLSPNVCAVYVEKDYRGRGIAGDLLKFVCDDFYNIGIDTLYLITDHTTYYERYGWNFLCMVQGDGEAHLTRMYIKKHRYSLL